MRTHINNKLYDTDTATRILYLTNSYNLTDIRYQEISIYRKKTGEYFLYRSNRLSGAITPLSYNEAEQYIREYGTEEVYQKEFGYEQGVLSLRFNIPKDVKKKLDKIASIKGKPRTQCIIDLIREADV